MPQAFVLMNAELGSEDSIVNELKKIEGVKEVYQVYGVYDIVAQVESNTMERVKETITWKLRKLNGVKSTLTMIVMEWFTIHLYLTVTIKPMNYFSDSKLCVTLMFLVYS